MPLRTDRFPFHVLVFVLVAVATGLGLSLLENPSLVIACAFAAGLLATRRMLRDTHRHEMISGAYMAGTADLPEDVTDPGPVPNSDIPTQPDAPSSMPIGDDVVGPQPSWTQMPTAPKLDAHLLTPMAEYPENPLSVV